jgi:osmotically inducible protein OsmC
MRLGSGAFEGPYSFASRFEDGTGTNPEELIAAAHAGCFSMALSAGLTKAGFEPTRIETRARVFFEKGESGFRIARIQLETSAEIPNIDQQTFQAQASEAKSGCPVSKALAAVPIDLKATLK